MSLHVNLSPEMEGFIKQKVASGFYGNATEVIRDAIRRMQAEDSRIDDEQIQRGEVVTYTPETLEEMTRAAFDGAYEDEPMDPDVLP